MIKFIGETVEDISDTISGVNPKWLRVLISIPTIFLLGLGVFIFSFIISVYSVITED